MASTSEVGHAKNVANFQDLITYCVSYGTPYNPPKANMQIASLNDMYTASLAEISGVATAKNAFDTVTGDRQLLFENVKPLSTRIINFLPVTDATEQTIADAKTINNLIQGRRATPKDKTTEANKETEAATASTSRQSYDMLTENFASLVDLASSIPGYTPNETDLTVASTTDYIASLRASNKAVTEAEVELSNARISRDKTLYADQTGMVDVALDVKKYVKAVFGATSPEYKQISGIKFTKL